MPATAHFLRWSRLTWAVGCCLIVATLIGCGLATWNLHEEALEQHRVALRTLGFVLAEQTTRYVQVVDLVLQEVQSRVAALDVRSPDELTQSFDTDAVRNFLRGRLADLPQANAFFMLRGDGRLVVSSRLKISAELDFSDRDYFRHFVELDDPAPFISGPVNSRIVGTPAVYVARRLNGPNGRFLGVVAGAIDLQFLTDFYRAIDLPAGQSVTLLRRDGLVLARFPDPAHQVGRWMPNVSPWYRIVSENGGNYRSPGFLAPDRAIISVHPLNSWQLVVDVSIREREALAKWRQQATVIAFGGLVTASGFVILFGVIGRQFSRKSEQNARLSKTAQALRASEARARDFAEMSSDWWWEADAVLHLNWVSDSPMIQTLGFSSRLGLTPWVALNADCSDPYWSGLCSDMAAHRPFRDFQIQERDPAGLTHHFSIGGNPVFDGTGAFTGYRGTGREITSEVEAQEQLRAAKEAAEAASRAKSEFLANMSHELRTPLNAIIGFSELIRDQPFGKIGANYVDYATDINAAGHHLLDLINDVLDLSKIEAGRYELVEEVVDLSVIVRAALGMLALRAKEGGVHIDDATRGIRVMLRCDRRAIKQVAINLVGNAVKFTPEGGEVSLRIARADAGQVVLTIADTGIGIEPAALQSLCAPFQQADASIARRFGGTGLGLAISRRLLALHGATLDISSVPGDGTTVRVTFPAGRVVALSGELREVALAV